MKSFKHYLLALALITVSTLSVAKETITILWAFNIGSNQANTVRIMCDELNASQDKYTFVIANKLGAGGTIAANAVESSPNDTLVSMSSSFIIRPYFEKDAPTHNLNNFTPIIVQGVGSPITFASGKYTKLSDALADPNLTIGVSGMGSISHLVANGLLETNKTATIVNFKSMMDAATAAAGGHIGLTIGLDADLAPLIDAGKLTMLGQTGAGTHVKQLADSDKLTANYAIFASTTMDQERFLEIRQLLASVNTRPAVVSSYKRDLLHPSTLTLEQSRTWYTNERAFWQKQVKNLK